MLRRPQQKRVKKAGSRPHLSLMLLGGAILAFLLWMFIAADPFQTANPFLRQTTIGQGVLGDWRYGGTDSSGQMKFYDAYQSVLLPGDARTFAADGQFVSIEAHTPTTITFEPAYESQTIGPAIALWIGLLATAGVVAFWRGGHHRSSTASRFRTRAKSARFRR